MTRLVPVLVATALLAVACSASDQVLQSTVESATGQDVQTGEETSNSERPSTPSNVSLTNLRSDYYALHGLLSTAQSIEANKCMIDLGFEPLPIVLPPDRPNLPPYVGELGRLALTESGARLDGYASTVLSIQGSFEDPREQLQRSLDRNLYDERWFEAWHGEILPPPAPSEIEEGQPEFQGSTGGCFSDAAVALEEGTSKDDVLGALRTVESLWSDVYQLSEQDERYREALQRWSGCMRESGFADLDELIDAYSAAQDLKISDPTLEIEQAINDARCQSESGIISAYATVWLESEATVQSSNDALQFYGWHQENFASISQQVETMLDNAG